MSTGLSSTHGPNGTLSLGQVVARTIGGFAAAGVIAIIVWQLSFLIAPLLLAFLISYCLGPIVNLLESRGLARWAAVLLCLGTGLVVVFVLGAAAWPSLQEWLKETPKGGERSVFEIRVDERFSQWQSVLQTKYPRLAWAHMFGELRTTMENQRHNLMETLPAIALEILGSAGTFLLAPIIGLFILLNGWQMQKAVVALVPNRHFETVLVLLHRVDRQVAGYLRGAASESGLVFVLLSLVLFIIGMPDAFLFAAIYALMNVVPIAGPLIGASAGLIFALVDPTAPGVGVLAFGYLSVYALDAMFINPLVVGKNLNLHPLTIIVGISIGGHLGGIIGMLLCIPFIAIGKAIIGTVADAIRQQTSST